MTVGGVESISLSLISFDYVLVLVLLVVFALVFRPGMHNLTFLRSYLSQCVCVCVLTVSCYPYPDNVILIQCCCILFFFQSMLDLISFLGYP